ncbi:MAG: DUF3365 domain-containing protein [Bacteroidales bacterium]|nr:DUF3365 domain-containing protein [Bacteroidales bacterium]
MVKIKNKHKGDSNRKGIMKLAWLFITSWTVIMALLLAHDLSKLSQTTKNLAINEARINFEKDKNFRFWAAKHGGFYVPVNERTPPNPFLSHVPERDIETPSGVKLTLMNPAYAQRQLNEDLPEISGVAGHITSLKPLRPENAPDDWEQKALKSFENGKTEALGFCEFEGQQSLRLMRPLIMQEGCLKCHGHQGYKIGDVRGGVSFTVPLAPYLAEEHKTATAHIFSLALLWILGIVGIILSSRVLRKKSFELESANKLLQDSYSKLETNVQGRTAELAQTNRELKAEITGRKAVESKLKLNETMLRQVIDATPNCIFVKDRNGMYLVVNKKMAEMHNKAPEEFLGKYDHEFAKNWFETTDYKEFRKAEQDVIDSKKTLFVEEDLFVYDDGTERWFQTTKIPFDIEENQNCILIISVDITERKLANFAVEASEIRFKSLFDSLLEGVSFHELVFNNANEAIDYRILDVNPSYEKILGLKKEDIINKLASEIYGAKEPPYLNAFVEVTKTGKPTRLEVNFQPMNKKFSISVFSTRKDRFATVFEDITERKHNELVQKVLYNISNAAITTDNLKNLIRLIQKELGTIIDTTNFYVALYDHKTHMFSIPLFSDENDEISSFPAEGTMTYYVFKTQKSLLANKEKINELEKSGETLSFGTDSEIWLGVPLKIESKVIGVLVVQSYTNENAYGESDMKMLEFIADQISLSIERKKVEQDLIENEKRLKELNASKDKFFGIIGHDLINPFGLVMSASEELSKDYDNYDEEDRKKLIEIISKDSKHAMNLLQNLLEWSRSQRGLIKYDPELFFIKEVIDENIRLLKENAEKKQNKLRSNILPSLIAYADKNMFSTIIRNLLSNAIKFTEKGTIYLSSEIKDSQVHVSIIDSGVGIKKQLIEKLFKIDESISTLGTSGERGTGLGLNLCKEFVKINKGKIWVESTVDEGSKFTFSIPVKP